MDAVMVTVKATADSEAAVMPGDKAFEAISWYSEAMVMAGHFVADDGLHPSSRRARGCGWRGNRAVVDGSCRPRRWSLVSGS
jgi:hypothetical protein